MKEAELKALTRPSVNFGGERMHLSTYVTPDVHEALGKVCRRLGYSQSGAIRAAVAEWLIARSRELKSKKAE